MCALGRRGPPRRRKAPLSVSREAARPLRTGNSERLLESLARPGLQVCPGQSGVSSHAKRPGGPRVCPRPLPTPAFPLPEPLAGSGSAPFLVALCPVGAGPAVLLGVEGAFASLLCQIFASLRFPHRAAAQPRCEPSGLKRSLLFKAFFLAPGHACLPGYLGSVVQAVEACQARKEGWGSPQWGGISL